MGDGIPPEWRECPHGCPEAGGVKGGVHLEDCPIALADDQMMATDREWFQRHPLAASYFRPLVPGDIESSSLRAVMRADDANAQRVLVRRMGEGARVRTIPSDFGLLLPMPGLSDEDTLAAKEGVRFVLASREAAELPDDLLPALCADGKIESPAEMSFWRAAWRRLAITPQHKVGRYRLDFAIIDKKVAIEIDGLAYHNGQESFIKDQQRQRDIQAAGWSVIRFAAKEALDKPGWCVSEVERLIR